MDKKYDLKMIERFTSKLLAVLIEISDPNIILNQTAKHAEVICIRVWNWELKKNEILIPY